MLCSGCSLTDRVQQGGTALLHPTATYLLDRLQDYLSHSSLRFERKHSTLSCQIDSFQDFIRTLVAQAQLTSIECDQIKVAHLLPRESYGPDLLEKTRSLSQWAGMVADNTLLYVLQNDTFEVHFQPIVDLLAGTVYGQECLIRGRDAEGRLVAPTTLLNEARQTDLLFNLDRQMRLACLRGASALTGGYIFINFVPTSIYNPEFCLRSTEALAKELSLDPERIVFEVVETEKVEDNQHLINILHHYRRRGFKIALDDVAAGYSGLLQLMKIKPDIMKMDREVISGVHNDPDKQSMVRAMLGIASDFGITPLAEGIETAEEMIYLKNQGVRLAQGYHFCRPMPVPCERLSF